MIAVDTSALITVVLRERMEPECRRALVASPRTVISAGTLAEALVVASGRKVSKAIGELIDELDLEIIPVTASTAVAVAAAYARWGKGVHAARLNFGDCFAYVTAMEHDCPLLYVGADFPQTDVRSALGP